MSLVLPTFYASHSLVVYTLTSFVSWCLFVIFSGLSQYETDNFQYSLHRTDCYRNKICSKSCCANKFTCYCWRKGKLDFTNFLWCCEAFKQTCNELGSTLDSYAILMNSILTEIAGQITVFASARIDNIVHPHRVSGNCICIWRICVISWCKIFAH